MKKEIFLVVSLCMGMSSYAADSQRHRTSSARELLEQDEGLCREYVNVVLQLMQVGDQDRARYSDLFKKNENLVQRLGLRDNVSG